MKFRVGLAMAMLLPATLIVDGAARAQVPTIELVSVNSNGALSFGGNSGQPDITPDGRFVAFTSFAADLVVGDTNADWDVFVRDRNAGTTERVSVSTSGAQASGGTPWASRPAISDDGRFVAFDTYASSLVAGDNNNHLDVFLRDRQSGTTSCVSVDLAGQPGNSLSSTPAISSDGRFVAFYSESTNLIAIDANGPAWDVFVRDLATGTTTCVSVSTAGAQGNNFSWIPSISATGRFVAFWSNASNLVTGGTSGGYGQIYVHDRASATTELVSVSGGAQGNDGSNPQVAISDEGRFVAFSSRAFSLVAGDTNGTDDVFVRDRVAGTTERVSISSTGGEANGASGTVGKAVAISADGRTVAFQSFASNLVLSDTNGIADYFVHDRLSKRTERVNIGPGGVQANGSGGAGGVTLYGPAVSISADSRIVAFDSNASNLVPGDTNVADDVFVSDRHIPAPSAYCTAGTSSNGCNAIITASANPSVSFSTLCSINVSGIDGQRWGIVFYGVDHAGFTPIQWASGSTSSLCVKAAVERTPVQNSGGTPNVCDGAYTLDWNAYQSTHPLAQGNPWSAGAKVHAQAWFRDPLAVKSSNLSNALEMTYVP